MNKLLLISGIVFLLMLTTAFAETITYSPFTKTVCIDGKCKLNIYSGVMFVYEDGIWKIVETAKSLKGKGFDVVYIEKDPTLNLTVLDFNYSYMTLSLKVDDKLKDTDIPLQTYMKNDSKLILLTGDYKKDYVVKSNVTLKFAKDEIKTIIIPFKFGSILEFGSNSTTITLNESNGGNLGDINVRANTVNDCYSTDATTQTYNNTPFAIITYVKWNLSIVAGKTINEVNFSMNQTDGGTPAIAIYNTSLYLNNSSSTQWKEEATCNIAWMSQPDQDKLQSSVSANGLNKYTVWNVTEGALTASANATNQNMSLRMINTGGDGGGAQQWGTKENTVTNARPQLLVVYTESGPTAPQWYVNQTSTPATYTYTTKSEFNVTWNNSDTAVDKVLIELNWTGTPTNYTMTNATFGGNIYNYTMVIGANTGNQQYWKSFANDTGNDWNATEVIKFTINRATPLFSTAVTTPITYANESDYTGSESNSGDGGCDYKLWRNGTLLSAGSGEADTTVLKAGAHNYTYNTTGCANWTAGKDEKTLVVNRATPILRLTVINVTYPTIMTVNASEISTGDSDCTYKLWINTTANDTGSEVNFSMRLKVGPYNFSYNISQCENYSASMKSNSSISILIGTTDAKLYIDGVSSNKTITHPTRVIIKGNSSTIITPPLFNLTVDGFVNVSQNPASSPLIFGVGTHRVVYNTSGTENWTSASNNSLFVIVNQNNTNPVELYLNDSAQNFTWDDWQIYINSTAVLTWNASKVGNITIWLWNLTTGENLMAEGNSPLENITNFSSQFYGEWGVYQVKVNASGNENYSANATGISYYVRLIKNVGSGGAGGTGEVPIQPLLPNPFISYACTKDEDCLQKLGSTSHCYFTSNTSAVGVCRLPQLVFPFDINYFIVGAIIIIGGLTGYNYYNSKKGKVKLKRFKDMVRIE